MRAGMVAVPAAVFAAVLIAAGLWAWQGAFDLVLDWGAGRPDVAAWAVRGAAIAAVAAAQIILLALVVGRVYRRGRFDTALALTAVAVFALAAVSAVACGLAGR